MNSLTEKIAHVNECIDQCHFQLNKLGQLDPRTDEEERTILTFVHRLQLRQRELTELKKQLPRK
jgi:hypothetical protein